MSNKNNINPFSYKGTLDRKAFFVTSLCLLILTIILCILTSSIGEILRYDLIHGGESNSELQLIFFLTAISCLISILLLFFSFAKRLRDAGIRLAWLFVNLVPLPFILLIFWLFLLFKPSKEIASEPKDSEVSEK